MRSLAVLLLVSASAVAAEPVYREISAQARVGKEVAFVVDEPGVGKVTKTKLVVEAVPLKVKFAPAKAAIVLCDVWDDHWCKSAAERCDGLAKKIAGVVEEARKEGFTIIHCPSDTMDFYKDSPARNRAQAAKKMDPPKNRELPDPPLPIDDSDGGCDDAPPTKFVKAWKRQHAAVKIDEEKDYVTDSGKEVYNVLKEQGIETVFVLGVHTNMCVLNRSFAIKQLRRWDVSCYLVRDLTDAMYNPKMKPFVTHAEGTSLVIAHIERHWCPSVTSDQLTVPKK